jgi:hypothetical protein
MRWQLQLIYATLAVTALSSFSAAFYSIFRCGSNPDDYVFRQLANECTPRALDRFFAYQHAAFSFLTDCIFATLPILILWNVNMERKWKIYVGFILSLALLYVLPHNDSSFTDREGAVYAQQFASATSMA